MIGICASAVVVADFGLIATKLAGCIATASNGCGLLFARDERAARRKWVEIQSGETEIMIDKRKAKTDL